ncbi:MAG: hypothetical protein DRP50_02070 [Thermotoga sp.]|nr:MAG: hypothetical protein DRP50_02070 [Thermotoga sp.]
MKKRLFVVLLISLLIMISQVGIAKEKVVLRVVSRTWAKDVINWATQKLKENHPELDITVNYSLYDYNECRTQLAMRLARGEPLDVITVDHIWLGQFKDMIYQIDQKEIKDYSDWVPSFRSLMEKYATKGKTLGLYAGTDVRLLFWNKELMKKLGIENVRIKTWRDVKYYALLIKLKENLLPKGAKPVGFMAGPTEHTNSRWYDYLWAAGGDILSPDETKAVFNGEAGGKALEFYGWFLKHGMLSPEDALSPTNGAVYDQACLNGKFVISLGNGHWLGDSTARDIGMSHEEFLQKFGAALIPAPDEGGERGACVAGGYLWAISKFAKHPKLAEEFIYYITGSEEWNVEGKGKYGIPTVSSALPTIKNLPYHDLIEEALRHAHFRPTIPEYPKIAQIIRDAIQKYVMNYDKMSAKEILDETAEKVNEILKK